ncbi:nuclear export factor [Pseudohyphozyma bogoriensis]|nr:nuclear export factor [Pseudohyphozyma bogoriensis]
MSDRTNAPWRGGAASRGAGRGGRPPRGGGGAPRSAFAKPTLPVIDSDNGGDSGMEADEESPAPMPVPAAYVHVPLEALGEDSESRKKRFESSMSNNRFMEMKPLREQQRQQAIKDGILPDPTKPRRLDEAMDFVGTCDEMCPEFEREEREYQNNVDLLERYPGTNRIDPSKAVKAFHRPAAGNEQPLPSDVRPPWMLERTLDYLFHVVLPAHEFHLTHPFLRDRTRSVRQDFTMQNVRGVSAIECNERIARYHILALGVQREQVGFSESQELEQLRKVLKSLNEFYDDARFHDPPIPAPNEPEFRSYNILTHLRDPDIIWSTELLPPAVFNHPLFQTALSLHALAQRSNIERGERASLNAFSRFFKLLAKPEVPYLFGCILATHFNEIRRNALDALKKTYIKGHSPLSARNLAKILGCDDEEEVLAICDALGIPCTESENGGKLVVEIHRGIIFKNGTIKPHVSKRLVEAKRGSIPYPEVIDGKRFIPGTVPSIPPTPSLASPAAFRRVSGATTPSSLARPPAAEAPKVSGHALGFGAPPTTTGSYFPPQPSPQPSTSMSNPFGAFPKTSAFGAKQPVSAIPTPIMTPEVTPPPPSFSLPSPAVGPSAPPSAPSSAFPSKLNPAASSFVPPSFAKPAPPPPAPTQPLAVIPTTAPSPASLFAPVPPKAQPAETRKPSLTIKSAKPSPSPLVTSTKPAASPKSPLIPTTPLLVSPAHGAARSALVDLVTKGLTRELLEHVVQLPARRAGEQALKERWELLLNGQKQAKTTFVDAVTKSLTSKVLRDLVSLTSREVAFAAKKEARQLRRTFDVWLAEADDSVIRREQAAERARQFSSVAGEIGVGPKRRRVSSGHDELDELDISSLSIKAFDLDGMGEDMDRSMAQLINKAQRNRHDIWSPGTLLDLIAGRVDTVLRYQNPVKQVSWNAILATAIKDDAFSSWLACKFALEAPEMKASMDTTFADVQVSMVCGSEKPSSTTIENTGLLIFDCTMPSGEIDSDTFWLKARGRLHALASSIVASSVYKVSLLVIFCPDAPLDAEAEATLRAKIVSSLAIGTLQELQSLAVFLARIGDAEAQLEGSLSNLLPTVEVRPHKVLLPLSVELAISLYVAALNDIVEEISSAAGSPFAPLPVPDLTGSPRQTVRRYVEQSVFHNTANFGLVESALAQRPLVQDVRLARLLLEHLVQFVRTEISHATIRREAFDASSTPALTRVQATLNSASWQIGAADGPRPPVVAGGAGGGSRGQKKRKASLSPSVVPIAQKKTKETEGVKDRLSAMRDVMRDARGLLSPATN